MEAVNNLTEVLGTVHFGNPKGELGGSVVESAATGAFAGAFHVYAIDWNWDSITWCGDHSSASLQTESWQRSDLFSNI